MQLPNSSDETTQLCDALNEQLEAHGEWFYTQARQIALSLRRNELEFRVEHGRLYFACWGRTGAQMWRVTECNTNDNNKITLTAVRRMGAEVAQLELVPRASVRAGKIAVAQARLDLCARLAHLAQAQSDGATLESLALSRGAIPSEPGPYARIVLRQHRLRIYVTGPVTPLASGRVDAFLASALLWWAGLKETSAQNAVFWVLADETCAALIGERLAVLCDEWRGRICLGAHDAACSTLQMLPLPDLADIWARPVKALKLPPPAPVDDWAAACAAQYPHTVDAVRGRLSTTLRWHGLPFARTRRIWDAEQIRFGLDTKRRHLLDDETRPDWSHLIAELHAHRRADAPDKRHELYRARSEAWLETLLRQDITQLDPGLVVAPLHAQLRAAPAGTTARPVDLLALRHDGRLAVIELKTSADRTHVLQGADYWLRVEQQRRQGHLATAQLFGQHDLADEPALLYVVAPLLSFHPACEILAAMIRPEIEIFRFDLNEDWRNGVRVARRQRLGKEL